VLGIAPQVLLKASHDAEIALSHLRTAAPTVALLLAESPGGTLGAQYFPTGSVITLDEVTTARPDDPNRGSGATVAAVADAILTELCRKWGVRVVGCLDDACVAGHSHATTIADEYASAGLALSPARKADRLSGWTRLRRYMADAGTADPDFTSLARARTCGQRCPSCREIRAAPKTSIRRQLTMAPTHSDMPFCSSSLRWDALIFRW
jgi:hypothetical protein